MAMQACTLSAPWQTFSPPPPAFIEARDESTEQLKRALAGENAEASLCTLHMAATAHSLEDVMLHLQPTDSTDVNARDEAGMTPLMLACFSQVGSAQAKAAVVRALLEAGADTTLRCAPYGTALHIACRTHSPGAAEALVAARAPVNTLDDEGRAPLHLVCGVGATPLWQVALREHANAAMRQMRADNPSLSRQSAAAEAVPSSKKKGKGGQGKGGSSEKETSSEPLIPPPPLEAIVALVCILVDGGADPEMPTANGESGPDWAKRVRSESRQRGERALGMLSRAMDMVYAEAMEMLDKQRATSGGSGKGGKGKKGSKKRK